MYIPIIVVAALVLTISLVPINVNASGFGRCTETSTSGCEERDRHPESYCLTIEEDPFCDDIDICDDEGEINSTDMFCTGQAVRMNGSCPEGFHDIEGDESGLYVCDYDIGKTW